MKTTQKLTLKEEIELEIAAKRKDRSDYTGALREAVKVHTRFLKIQGCRDLPEKKDDEC